MKQDRDYQTVITDIHKTLSVESDLGSIAEYIPALSVVDANQFGICLTTTEGQVHGAGDFDTRFSIQSISKVMALTVAFREMGDELWQRVGVEPSGTAFNSLVQLEYERGIPRNPFLNAGALVVCDVLLSLYSDPERQIINFVRALSENECLDYNETAARSELKTAYRNYALIYLMKEFGNIHNDINRVLALYCRLCSIELSCQELSRLFLYLAADGYAANSGVQIIDTSKTKRINALMQLCGFYDEAGDYSFRVGLPGKSGVGGGVIGINPGLYCVTAWSPKLNEKGNSYKGMKVLEYLTTQTQSSVF